MPRGLFTRGGEKELAKWNFNGADMDQGLFTHHFILNKGNGMLIDTSLRTIKLFDQGYLRQKPVTPAYPGPLRCCDAVLPTDMFLHFTGQQKPWMKDLANIPPGNRNLRRWARYLDDLKLEVNSTNIGKLGLGSPLGFWNTKLKVKVVRQDGPA